MAHLYHLTCLKIESKNLLKNQGFKANLEPFSAYDPALELA